MSLALLLSQLAQSAGCKHLRAFLHDFVSCFSLYWSNGHDWSLRHVKRSEMND